jgi:hypothetical protein
VYKPSRVLDFSLFSRFMFHAYVWRDLEARQPQETSAHYEN